MYEYFYSNDIANFTYIKIPNIFFEDKYLSTLSLYAKVLYGMLLDRTSLSAENGWRDNKGRVFIYFKQELVSEKLSIGTTKTVQVFNELEKFGLIERQKQGQGKPVRIYVLNFTKRIENTASDDIETPTELISIRPSEYESQDFQNLKVKTFKKQKSRPSKSESQDFQNMKANHTKINHTKINQTNLSSINQSDSERSQKSKSQNDELMDGRLIDNRNSEIIEETKEQIGYEYLNHNLRADVSTINLIVKILAEVYTSNREYITVSQQLIPRDEVVRQFRLLDEGHIEYVLDSFKKASLKTPVKNVKAYFLTCLYNAPDTIDTYYDSVVAHDLAQSSNLKNLSKEEIFDYAYANP